MAEVPPKFDQAQLDRIIRRAAELQLGERGAGDGLTAAEIEALGKEVGIPAEHLRQAVLEERARPSAPAPAGLLDRVAGPATVSAQRVVKGEAAAVEARLLAWMDEEEVLGVRRHIPGAITWESLGGWQAALRKSSKAWQAGARSLLLNQADEVRATITSLEDGYQLVALEASLGSKRAAYAGGAATLLIFGGVAGSILAILGALMPVPFLPPLLGLGAAWAALRGLAPLRGRVELGLERVLDHLERTGGQPLPPPAPPSLLGTIAREVGRALKP